MADRTFFAVHVTDLAGAPLPVRSVVFRQGPNDDTPASAVAPAIFVLKTVGPAQLVVTPPPPYPVYALRMRVTAKGSRFAPAFKTQDSGNPLTNNAALDVPRMVDAFVMDRRDDAGVEHFTLVLRLGPRRRIVLVVPPSAETNKDRGAAGVAAMESLAAGKGGVPFDPSTEVVLRDFNTGLESRWVLGRSPPTVKDHFWAAGWTRLSNEPLPDISQPYTFSWAKSQDEPDILQYVNVPAHFGDHCGNEVVLDGRVQPPAPGRIVTFTLMPDAKDIGKHPDAWVKASATSDEQGLVRATVHLPHVGGARFHVSAETPFMEKPVASRGVVVWRRLYYQLTTMKDSPAGVKFAPPPNVMSTIKEAMDRVFVDFQRGETPDGEWPYYENDVGPNEEQAVEALRVAARDRYSPYKTNIVFIDGFEYVQESEYVVFAREDSLRQYISPIFAKPHFVNPIISVEYERGREWISLEGAMVFDLLGGLCYIEVRVPPEVPLPARLRFKYRYVLARPLGKDVGDRGINLICMGFGMKFGEFCQPSLNYLIPVLIHELGHGLGLLMFGQQWYDRTPENTQGDIHCGRKDAADRPVCVMWYRRSQMTTHHFCTGDDPNNCSYSVMHTDLSKVQWI